ncbi:MAG: restriction endonuclease [Nitrososphaerota archaeon]|nr:restriction endonuclease [Nitrososphaerota archaeon]MDG7023418.1 restriction endonuclease [Nitrososphaerota archaeon]
MLQQDELLLDVLERRLGKAGATRALRDVGGDLGLSEGDYASPVSAAYSLLKANFQADEVSRLLSWQDFERLAGALLRSSGYDVRQNVYLRKPRAQIDVVATGPSLTLSVDCKHYRREQGPSSLERAALAQLRRSALLRRVSDGPRPIASVILSMSEPEGKFVRGVAVVPVRTFRSFLNSLDSYRGLLELR